jgi:hypothetical protein
VVVVQRGEAPRIAMGAGPSKASKDRRLLLDELTDVRIKNIEKRYQMHEELGTGFSSAVLLASRRDIPGKEEVALKVLPLKVLLNPKSELLDTLKTEVELLRGKVKHPCIVRLIETCCDAKSFFIVLEPLKGGDLLGALANRRFFPEDLARGIFANVVLAVEHLHKCKLVHRDIKAENLCTIDVNSTEYKLIDFGSCADTSAGDVNGLAATAHYCAPEVLKSAGYAEATGKKGAVSILGSGLGYNGPASDMWSLGVLLFFMLTRKLPFGSTMDTSGVIVKRIVETTSVDHAGAAPERWSDLSAEAKDLIESLMKMEPTERPTWDGVRSHPWCRDAIEAREAVVGKGAPPPTPAKAIEPLLDALRVAEEEEAAAASEAAEKAAAEAAHLAAVASALAEAAAASPGDEGARDASVAAAARAEAAKAAAEAAKAAKDESVADRLLAAAPSPAVAEAGEPAPAPVKPLTKKEKLAAAKAEKEKVAAAKAEKEAAAKAKKEEAAAAAKAKIEEAKRLKDEAIAKKKKPAKGAKGDKGDTLFKVGKVEDVAPVAAEGEAVGAEGESAGAEAAEAPASADDMTPDMSTKEAAPAVEAAAESQSAPAKPLTKKEKAAAAKAAKEAAAKAEKEKVAAAKAEKEAAAIAKKEEAVAKAKAKTEEAAAAKAAKAAAAKAAKDAKKAKNNKADSADSTPQQREKVEDTAVEGEGEKVVQMI